MKRPDDDGKLVPVIDHDEAKKLSPEQIIGRFDFDHVVYETWGGTTHPSNLVPRQRADHRAKTSKKDIPAIAKVKRSIKDSKFEVSKPIFDAEEPLTFHVKQPSKPSKPMPGSKNSQWKKPLNGPAIRRSPVDSSK